MRSWLVIVAINAGVFLTLFFGVTEWFIARKARTTLIYRPSARFHHELLPDQTYARDGFSYRIGSLGLRAGEPRPKRGRRLVVLGGSSAFDFRVARSWPEKLGDALGVDTYNGAIPGYSLREIVPFYEDRIRRLGADRVAIYVGWNDLKTISASRDRLTLAPFPEDGDPPAQYDFLRSPRPIRNLLAIPVMLEKVEVLRENRALEPPPLSTTTATRAVAWSETPGLAHFRGELERLIDLVESDGAEVFIILEITLASPDLDPARRGAINLSLVRLSYAELLDANEAIARVQIDVAERRRIPYVDLRTELGGRPEHFFDHVHLTEAGSDALAERVAGAMRGWIATAAGDRGRRPERRSAR
jgi:lysophospholipase L1-like esterase